MGRRHTPERTRMTEDAVPLGSSRSRRCIVTGEILPEARLVRFVLDPVGNVVPDVRAKLPGRGMWVSAERSMVERAARRGVFTKAAGRSATVPGDLVAETELAIVQRILSWLGIARRSGGLSLGFERVDEQIRGLEPPAVIVEASDAGPEGRRKMQAAVRSAGYVPFVLAGLSKAELSLSLGRENVVHAAVKPG